MENAESNTSANDESLAGPILMGCSVLIGGGILLGLHSAAQRNLLLTTEIMQEISDISKEFKYYPGLDFNIEISYQNLTDRRLQLNRFQTIYRSVAAQTRSLQEFMAQHEQTEGWLELIANNHEQSAALLSLYDACVRAFLLYAPQDQSTEPLQWFFKDQKDPEPITANFNIGAFLKNFYDTSRTPRQIANKFQAFLRILVNGIVHGPQQFSFALDSENSSLILDLGNLNTTRGNTFDLLARTLEEVPFLNTVFIANANFNKQLHHNALLQICGILGELGSIEYFKVYLNATIIHDRECIASCLNMLRLNCISNATPSFQGDLELLDDKTVVAFTQHRYKQEVIARQNLYFMQREILNTLAYGPTFSYKQVIATLHQPKPSLYLDPNFLVYLGMRVKRLHPATIHALYLKAIVLNNKDLKTITAANLDSKFEEITVSCDKYGIVELDRQSSARNIIDATVLTRYGARVDTSIYCNGSDEDNLHKMLNIPVVQRCKTASRTILVSYRQKLRSDLSKSLDILDNLDYQDTMAKLRDLFCEKQIASEIIIKKIMQFSVSQSESQEYKYKPLREIYDQNEYTDYGKPNNNCCIS